MKISFKLVPEALKKIIRETAEVSQETGLPAYLVGGFLRDLILGVKNLDLDITVIGDGINFAQRLAKRLKADLRKHDRFKTATLMLASDLKVDVATARTERYPGLAMLPVVSPGSLEGDLRRRDFSINALALRILPGKDQQMIDLFNGQKDLAAGKIRVLHALSFLDDPTRILRAVRFEQRYNFKIEPLTLALLKQAVAAGLLQKTHAHRLRDELVLMLKEFHPFKQINRLGKLGALIFLSRNLKIGLATKNLFKRLEEEVLWFQKNFSFSCGPLDVGMIYLAALLGSLPLVEVKAIIQKLGLCRKEEEKILSFYTMDSKFKQRLSDKRIKPAEIFSLLESLSCEVIILLRASSANGNLRQHLADFLKIYRGMRLEVRGKDLHNLGVLPGPCYKKIFAQVWEAKLNGQVRSYEEEVALIKSLIK